MRKHVDSSTCSTATLMKASAPSLGILTCALTASLATQATPWEAGVLATLAAGVVVCILHQTGTASPEEILGLYDRQSSRYTS